jgi:type IV secretion system protein VirB3
VIMPVPSEAIYKGATRPAMKFGVPLVPLVLLFGAGMLAIMWVGPLFTWWVLPIVLATLAPTVAWMRFVTRRDDQRFRQIFLAVRLRWADRNRRFWHARSYTPYCHRGARDVAHR